MSTVGPEPTTVGLLQPCGSNSHSGALCNSDLACVEIDPKLSSCLPVDEDSDSCDTSGNPPQPNYLPCGGQLWFGPTSCESDSVCVTLIGSALSLCMPLDPDDDTCAQKKRTGGGGSSGS